MSLACEAIVSGQSHWSINTHQVTHQARSYLIPT